ncbi:uncharacterized protein LOC114531189 [Dendronephthya gigantea]|uniref:uncharacterized protein LOC114531189 n=1 Tax=Dendronephthya gigantea TaxID=151771 RepID=UPI0010693084|nr:uncharacterized protein LOC114531189 [Dendronephthya gigantea]
MLAASKEKGCERIGEWTKAARNHIYWCSTSTVKGFGSMIQAKWKSFMRHVANKHDDHPDQLFPKCAHEELEDERKWIKIGTRAHDKLQAIIMKKTILKDVKKLSPDAQTSSLEGFHSTLNQWHPKMICFSWLGTYCRHILAILHFNENIKRKQKTTKDGKNYVSVTYPKFKFGDEVVRNIPVPPTYNYVEDMKHLLFATSEEDLDKMIEKYEERVPKPLNSQFLCKVPRDEAITKNAARKRKIAELYPSGELQNQEMVKEKRSRQQLQQRRPRCCKKCKLPMKGHPRSHCPTQQVAPQ